MLPFFSATDRTQVLEQLQAFASSQTQILGTVLVGSGTSGFRDEYSDVDILYVVEPQNISAAFTAITHFTATLRPVFSTTYQHRDDVFVICLLLDNYLEIDIGVWSTASLFATRPNWRVVQARDTASAHTIKTCLAHNLPLERTHEPVVSGDDPQWQFIYGRYIAEKRADADKIAAFDQQIKESPQTSYNAPQIAHIKPLIIIKSIP